MTDEWALLRKLASRENIPFEPARLPTRKWQTLASGIRLSYLDWPDNGPVALFLHGGALTAHTFDLVCLEIGDGYHCVALELRGHGDSDWAEDSSIGTLVDDIAAFADTQDWSRFHLVGMSLGGGVAGHFAATNPGRLRTLALIDVGPRVNFESTAPMRQFFVARCQQDRASLVVVIPLPFDVAFYLRLVPNADTGIDGDLVVAMRTPRSHR